MDVDGRMANKLQDIGYNTVAAKNNLQDIEQNLPPVPKKAGVYMPIKEFGTNMAYVSGCLPMENNAVAVTGKLGNDCSIEDACRAAELCTLNILAILKEHLGSLSRIKNCVKMTVLVASTADFYQQSQVANAATELLVSFMGEKIGCPSRAAFGVASLPLNAAVEIELMVEVY
ncbi:MAG: RidA family protein [Defluviitaleaceae bacterium]|nr:RidA family protein [Defluviitaleaceae bacterium]